MRLVDADALIISDEECEYTMCCNCKMQVNGCADFYDIIKNAPTIEERKTGEWIRKISVVDCATFVGDECSQCGYFKSMGQANFCPNCGADMRGGSHE